MEKTPLSLYLLFLFIISPLRPSARESFVVLDSITDAILISIGDISTQLSPCSTFKIALSLMGYDTNILTNEQTPQWDFHDGYTDLLPIWKASQTPSSWIKNSCVLYSQLLTPLIGKTPISDYLAKFDYGNQDFSGDPGKNNGLSNAWLSSSLKISPLQQVQFLKKIIRSSLPVSQNALDMTKNIILIETLPNGWKLFGKTGATSTTLEKDRQLGWFIGWVEKNELSYPFALVIQDATIIPSKRITRANQLLHEHLLKKCLH